MPLRRYEVIEQLRQLATALQRPINLVVGVRAPHTVGQQRLARDLRRFARDIATNPDLVTVNFRTTWWPLSTKPGSVEALVQRWRESSQGLPPGIER